MSIMIFQALASTLLHAAAAAPRTTKPAEEKP